MATCGMMITLLVLVLCSFLNHLLVPSPHLLALLFLSCLVPFLFLFLLSSHLLQRHPHSFACSCLTHSSYDFPTPSFLHPVTPFLPSLSHTSLPTFLSLSSLSFFSLIRPCNCLSQAQFHSLSLPSHSLATPPPSGFQPDSRSVCPSVVPLAVSLTFSCLQFLRHKIHCTNHTPHSSTSPRSPS